eukprot:CAMPEP_0198737240 /NCGR_PEP_ID=MMETSP1475-20131203/67767_1 /TAXON_ID= ORGANISM="Unidentified sp., Strain CCMP1999" /NCGR_SAMPLE_ID=MMETSP1475 /ASSEMBLY_ACC=CAM_ASM_001111 /LENGTH=96 /DNA_ID=CAMNT_0044501099 /DNA_START=352 /DNA_END=642 /DNA_ORIENTATION=-
MWEMQPRRTTDWRKWVRKNKHRIVLGIVAVGLAVNGLNYKAALDHREGIKASIQLRETQLEMLRQRYLQETGKPWRKLDSVQVATEIYDTQPKSDH